MKKFKIVPLSKEFVSAEIFETKSDVEYLHARNSEASCFICKIERV
ncbi:DUF1203 domain-containing protein [Flavobacterium sp. N2038]|nr:DUF1203 domain-containing protein [Flavobacterium sp. N2038]